MARPRKQGLEYFSVDVNFDQNLEGFLDIFEAKGMTFWMRLWQACYSNDSGELELLRVFRRKTFAKTCFCTETELDDMIGAAIDLDLLDKDAYESRKVLTSRGIQKRLANINGRRAKERDRKTSDLAEREISERKTLGKRSVTGEFPSGKPAKTGESKRERESTSTLTNVSVRTHEPPKSKTLASREILFTPDELEKLNSKMSPDEAQFWIEELQTKFAADKNYFRKYSDPVALALSWRRLQKTRDGKTWNPDSRIYEKPNGFKSTVERKVEREISVAVRQGERDVTGSHLRIAEPTLETLQPKAKHERQRMLDIS